MTQVEHGPSGSEKNKTSYSRLQKLVAGALFAISPTLSGCFPSSANGDTAPKPIPGSSAPTAPGPETTMPTEAPAATPDTTESMQPTKNETPDDAPMVEVPAFREWNIAPDTADRLQSAETDTEKWSVIKEVIVNNNEPGVYEGDTSIKTRSIEALFNRTLIEMATMADIAKDPNVEGGDIISQEWADLAIIDDATREKFIERTSNMRDMLTAPNQEDVNSGMELNAEVPSYHLQPEILHVSSDINLFHDSATDRDYNGITFTGIYKVPGNYMGYVTTITVIFDDGNYATQILREYPESTPGGWEITYNPGEAPIKVSEIPAVIEKTNS